MLHGHALFSPLAEDGLGMNFLLAGERTALEDEEVVLRSRSFYAVDPEPFHRRFPSARLDLFDNQQQQRNTA